MAGRDIFIDAPNVTLRRIQGIGSNVVNGYGASCEQNLLVEDSEFTANGRTADSDLPVIQFGGYTVRNIMIDGVPEGLRVGGTDIDCGPVSVYDSFIRVKSPTDCVDWHGRQDPGIRRWPRHRAPVHDPDGGRRGLLRNGALLLPVRARQHVSRYRRPPRRRWGLSLPKWDAGPGAERQGDRRQLGIRPGRCEVRVVAAWSAQVVRLDSAGEPSTVRSIGCTGQGN